MSAANFDGGTAIRLSGTGLFAVGKTSGIIYGISVPNLATGVSVTLWATSTGSGTVLMDETAITANSFLSFRTAYNGGSLVARITGSASSAINVMIWPNP